MKKLFILILTFALQAACSANRPEMKTVEYVDLERFMGDWFVIANIPTFVEKEAYNALENYALNDDGTIATTFTFNKGSFDGEVKEYTPKGFVLDKETNARWGMRFIWPIKADYRIIYLTDDYRHTVIGRQKRDYVWIMSREPEMADRDYQELLDFVISEGYEADEIRTVPQSGERPR